VKEAGQDQVVGGRHVHVIAVAQGQTAVAGVTDSPVAVVMEDTHAGMSSQLLQEGLAAIRGSVIDNDYFAAIVTLRHSRFHCLLNENRLIVTGDNHAELGRDHFDPADGFHRAAAEFST